MRMVGEWSSTGLFAGDSTQTVLGSMTNGSEVFSAFMKTRLLIKLNHSFILKTRTGAAPRDGREQSHWQEVFRSFDTIYDTSNIALLSIIIKQCMAMPNGLGHLRAFVPAAELALSTPDRLIIKTNLTYAVRTEKLFFF